ncbi:MAG: hypothetical protein IPJ69_04975 [Deltaproteobacteria bacterium]|nr:MAG: hypothetical protein IPJ69_04975 [Deltaproteobacteria bacterium]
MKLPKITLIFTLSLISMSAFADLNIPRVLNFQSVLRDDAGNLLPDTTTALEFRILDADGTQLYFETQAEVPVTRGAVNAMIGEGDIPGTNTPTGGIPLNALDPTTGEKLLQYRIGNNESVDPIEFGLVPYAFWSEKSLGVVNNAIGSDQIRNGSIKLEDLEPGAISFGDVGGMISITQIPVSIARLSAVTGHVNDTTGAHRASAISTAGPFGVTLGTPTEPPIVTPTVEEVLKRLDSRVVSESAQRDFHSRTDIATAHPNGTFPAARISGQMTTAQIADGAITSSKLASGAVGVNSIANASITGQKLDYSTGPSSIDDRYVNVDGDTMTRDLIVPDPSPPSGQERAYPVGRTLGDHETRLRSSNRDDSVLRSTLTTAGNLRPTNCTWGDWIGEYDWVEYICPNNKIMAGRQHGDDEHGPTRYYCCDLVLTLP